MLGLMFEKEGRELADLLANKGDELVSALSPYGQRYFGKILQTTRYNMQLSAILLERAVVCSGKKAEHLSIVDYGGGLGLTTLLASKVGFKSVLFVDLYKDVTVDARQIGKALNLSADEYIHGDIDTLIKSGKWADVLVSRDVIEHIYDLNYFFDRSVEVPGLNWMLHNTSANQYNILLMSYFNKIHKKAEFQLIRSKESIKKGEVQAGFLEARKSIIRDHFRQLSRSEIDHLAAQTRGYNRQDILKAVAAYIDHGISPQVIDHPTNTCEPETGNWAERLLSFEEYRAMARHYEVTFHPAPYNVKRPFSLKKLALALLNGLIFRLAVGPKIWPSIVLEMKRLNSEDV